MDREKIKDREKKSPDRTVTASIDFPPEGSDRFPLSEKELEVTSESPGRYRIIGERGRGGIGRVLVGFDEHVGREVALKELLRSGAKNGEIVPLVDRNLIARARFLREARVTGQLEHPNIVPVYEIGSRDDGTLYYTMRLVNGQTLASAIDKCIDLKERLLLLPHFRDICNAVAYAHSRGVVHRDLKPENIMLGEFGETVVLDWGLAKVKGESEQSIEQEGSSASEVIGVTVQGKAMGTPAYMSPEQARGEVDRVDERSDIYALGAVLYEILTGRPPYEGKDVQEVLYKVIHHVPDRIQDLEPDAPPELCAIVEKSFTPAREDRYLNAIDLSREIENYMSGNRVNAYEYSSWELFRRFVTKNKSLSIALGLLVAVLIFGSVTIFNAYRETVENERLAHLNLALGYQESAERLLKEKDYSKAKIFAAASLYHNPYNMFSPYRFPESSRLGTVSAYESILPAVSSYYTASVYRYDGYLETLHRFAYPFNGMALSPGAGEIAVAGKNGSVEIYNSKKGGVKGVFKGHRDEVQTVTFSPDGSRLLSAGWDGTVRIWNSATMEQRLVFTRHMGRVFDAVFSPDGKFVASTGAESPIFLWDSSSGSVIAKIPSFGIRIRTLAFSPDGSFLAFSGLEGEIVIYSIRHGRLFARLQAHREAVVKLAFSPDGRFLASAGYDRTIRLWSWRESNLLHSFKHWDAFFDVVFHPDGSKVAAASRDGTIRIWDTAQKRLISTLRGHDGSVFNIAFSKNGRQVISSGEDRRLILWKSEAHRMAKIFRGHRTYIPSVDISPNGRYMVTTSWDKSVRIWDLRKGKQISVLYGKGEVVYSALFSSDSRRIFCGGSDGIIRIYSLSAGKEVGSLEGHQDSIFSLALSPDGKTLFSGSIDKSVKAWEIGKGKLKFTLTGHESAVKAVTVSSDGMLIASGGRDKRIIVWSVPLKKRLFSLEGHSDALTSLDFSPDGKLLVSAGEDRSLRIWDIRSGKMKMLLSGHKSPINMVRFTPSGDHFVSIGESAIIWDRFTGMREKQLKLSYSGYSLAFSPAGEYFAVSDGPQVNLLPFVLDLWKKDPEELLKAAEHESGKRLEGFRIFSSE